MPAARDAWIASAREWVLAVERAYVAVAVGGGSAPGPGFAELGEPAVAAAAAGAVASRYLAVGTPRSIGLVGDPAHTALSLAAHRVWFQPRDLRCTAGAEVLGGRAVTLDEALAADIVCIHVPLGAPLAASRLRRGTHVNALAPLELEPDLRALAMVVGEDAAGLPALAAGLVDGRQLDELTIFLADDLAIARRALAPA